MTQFCPAVKFTLETLTSALARGVGGIGKIQTSRALPALSIPSALPGLSCGLSVLSTFKATCSEKHQRDRDGGIHAHLFSVCTPPTGFSSITFLQQSYPDLAVPSLGKRNFSQLRNLPVQYLDRR